MSEYPVSLVRFHLSMPDPDTTSQRYHTVIFVQTKADGSGMVHQATGDLTSPRGMYYYPEFSPRPEHSEAFYSKEALGFTEASTHPDSWSALLDRVSAPPQQKAFNLDTKRTEPFKTSNPLTFYKPGEKRKPLVKCTEWTLNSAIPALESAGLIHE